MAHKYFPAMVDITSSHIAEAARDAGEPAWLVDQRVQAWEFFAQAVPPVWRRTDISGLKPENITPLATPQGTAIQWEESLVEQGVVFCSLAAALQSHEALVKQKLGTAVLPNSHKFSALRAALWQDGVFLYVPNHVTIDIPLRVCYTLAEGSRTIFPYSLVILEPGAQVTFIEEFVSRDSEESVLAGPTTEMFLGEGSSLKFVTVQQWGSNVYHIGGQVQHFDAQAQSEWISVVLGAASQHVEADARLNGDGSCIHWLGATFANKKQHLLTAPSLVHTAAHTESHLDFRTVVSGEAYSVFDGMIRILHGSRDTTTRLEEHSVHLTPDSRSDSIPGLRIDTNDVASAGHASTSGQIDEEQLFYLQARGIPRNEAVRMIVLGMFEPVLNAIPMEEMREALAVAIEAKI